jgi:8-oxo-dGTP pyrophosphatase MutT (NUDIX family)
MASEKYNFQYCQKIVLFDEQDRVLLAQRKGESDFDETYSFIGGKLEITDGELINGMLREKQEEIGRRALILVAPQLSFNVYFTKKDGSAMVLPHVYGRYVSGEIELNDEYSNYKWVGVDELDSFEPKIDTIPVAVAWARKIREIVTDEDLVEIQ